MVDGINNVFKSGQKIELKNRGVNSGITYELKSVFDELAKSGVLKDKDGKGLSKKDALNLYNALNKIHKETNRATNYTKMQVGQNFEYTADEMKQLAQAAGYDIVETEQKPPKPVVQSKPSLAVEADIPEKINLPGTQPQPVDESKPSLAVEADIPDKINLQQNSAAEIFEKAGIRTLFPNGLPEGVTVQTININGTPTLIFKKDGQNLDMAQLKELVNSQQLQQAEEPVKPVTTGSSEGLLKSGNTVPDVKLSDGTTWDGNVMGKQLSQDQKDANKLVYEFVRKSAKFYNSENGLYTVRGFQSHSQSSAETRAENAMRGLYAQRNDYMRLKQQEPSTLTQSDKNLINSFEATLEKMQLQVDENGNFSNIEDSDFIRE